MGKRSDGTFDRIERDFYPTPAAAIPFLAPHLASGFEFCEPCAGDGTLVRHLEAIGGQCLAAYDISPQGTVRMRGDARNMLGNHLAGARLIITNPPWEREILHQLLMRFSRLAGTWVLLDADWAYTDQALIFMDWRRGQCRVQKIVAVGRLKWIPDSDDTGKDNCAWYYIGHPTGELPQFFPRLQLT